jgi:LuxR family maltose regulon positive regulatory protein
MGADHGDLIERRDVLRRLSASGPAGDTLVLLQAPAGYGKTVVLRQWAARDPRPFFRVRLRDTADDPGRLVASTWSALRRAGVRSPPAGGTDRACRPIVLVLDGVAGPVRSAGRPGLGDAVAALPPGSQVAVASRRRLEPDRDLGLGAGRLGARCLRIGVDDLVLSPHEVWRVVTRWGLECPPEVLDDLMERVEGWPAGVYLASMAMRGASGAAGVAAAVAAFSGDDARVRAYLRDQVLDGEPPEVRELLLRASVLERPAGPVCDAVLGTTGSAERLADAEERGLFLHRPRRPPAAPDDDGGLRFPRPVAEALRAELRERYPAELPVLHRRAADWFAAHGQPDPAVAHALAAGDTLRAARLVSLHAMSLVEAGGVARVRSWIEALGEDALEQYPPLGVAAAWTYGVSGDVPRALRSLLAAERGSFDGPLPDGASSLESAVAMVHATFAPRGVERMLVDARRAVELEPPGSRWRSNALLLLGDALLMSGRTGEAAEVYRRATRSGAATRPGPAQHALALLSLLAADREDWPQAEAAAAESTRLMTSGGLQDFMPSVLTYAARARVAVHAGRPGGAAEDVDRGLRLYHEQSPLAFPWFAAMTALLLGDLLLELGDSGRARDLAGEARVHVVRLLTDGVLGERLAELEARIEAAEHAPTGRAAAAAPLSQAEQRVLDLLATHLPLREIGVELHLSRNTVKSHVSAIHRKLGCTTRAQAVRRGRALGLINR